MRVAHFAPFAPHRAGLYETTRDMIVAERLAGAQSELVDVGVLGERRRVGAVDARGKHEVVARDYADVAGYDLFVCNGGIPENFLRQTRAPVVQVLHGRPESSFRLTQRKEINPYDLHARRAKDPRWRRFVTLWQEHEPYWATIVSQGKLRATEFPPCDLEQFRPDGPKHEFDPCGDVNVLLADIWRPDADPFHVVHGLMRADIPGLRVHVYAIKPPVGPWEHLFRHMRALNILGETKGVMLGIEQVYRAADVVVTPHRIATRIVREATACGTPVVMGWPTRHSLWAAVPDDPYDVAQATKRALTAQPDELRAFALDYGLDRFGPEILKLYSEAL